MNAELRLTPLTTEQALAAWDDPIAPLLRPAVERGPRETDMDGLREDVEKGLVRVFLIWNPETHVAYAVLYTEGHVHKYATTLQVSYCAGVDMAEWIHLYPALRAWALDKGFGRIRFMGRPGWKRMLREYVSDVQVCYVDDLQPLYTPAEQPVEVTHG